MKNIVIITNYDHFENLVMAVGVCDVSFMSHILINEVFQKYINQNFMIYSILKIF